LTISIGNRTVAFRLFIDARLSGDVTRTLQEKSLRPMTKFIFFQVFHELGVSYCYYWYLDW